MCEITVHLKRHFVKAHASSTEPEAALDLALDKVEHQVARIKEKRVAAHATRAARTSSGNGAGDPTTTSPTIDDDEADAARGS